MFLRRLRYWLRKRERDAGLRAEMEAHIEERAAELREQGLSESEAQAEARRRFGNIMMKREEAREIWVARYWSDFWRDLQYGARNLKRNPGFATVAILSAALGIGACSTVFSIVNAAIFRTLPVAEPDRLMAITAMRRSTGAPGDTLAFAEIRDLRDHARSWQGVAAFAALLPAAILPNGGEARRHWGFLVTANYFDVVRPAFAAGGGFVSETDDVPGAPPKIVLTHGLWLSRFGADPDIVGRTVQVNKRAMTVAGVTGPGFRGTEVVLAADFFLPFGSYRKCSGSGPTAGE